jgi:hypothetical protein|nr:MAG TPA: hypothetical protein [Caudoviricetes sp.]
MAEGKMHLASVLTRDPHDYVVIGGKIVEVDNTPRDAIDGAFLSVQGTTYSPSEYDRKRVSARFSTNVMIPRLDDDFNLDAYTINNGQVFELDRWPNEPVIRVELGQARRLMDSFGTEYTVEVSGFYGKPGHSDSSHTYVSLDGDSLLDQSAGDRIIKWRKATPTDFVAEQEKTDE